MIEEEAQRRILENDMVGRTLVGSISRDIIVACIVVGFATVKDMDKKQLAEVLKSAK